MNREFEGNISTIHDQTKFEGRLDRSKLGQSAVLGGEIRLPAESGLQVIEAPNGQRYITNNLLQDKR